MEQKDRDFIIKVSNEAQKAMKWIERYESIHGKLENIGIPTQSPKKTKGSAKKFFNINEESTIPVFEIGTNFKVPPTKIQEVEIEEAKKILQTMILEFCEAFNIEQFTVNYENDK